MLPWNAPIYVWVTIWFKYHVGYKEMLKLFYRENFGGRSRQMVYKNKLKKNAKFFVNFGHQHKRPLFYFLTGWCDLKAFREQIYSFPSHLSIITFIQEVLTLFI